MKLFKSLAALTLSAIMLAGCGGSSKNKTASEKEPEAKEEVASTFFNTDEEISYVMIYNPHIYDEKSKSNENLNTGSIREYVEAVSVRAGELEAPDTTFIPSSFADNSGEINLDGIDFSGNRAGALTVPYRVGERKDFYTFDSNDNRVKVNFTCKYVGTHCYLWTSDNSIDSATFARYGNEFDTKIYQTTIDTFGEGRFLEDGGKLNILFTDLQNGTGGLFYFYDLIATGEVSDEMCEAYMFNKDHAIININANYVAAGVYESNMFSTLAHEFQHLICATNFVYTTSGTFPRTWLNEGMSGYIEEKIYPGIQETAGRYEDFSQSNRIRHGQSMYNFQTTTTASEWDIGVYGSVFLFAEYLEKLAGEDVFSGINLNWKSAFGEINEGGAIKASVPSSVVTKINDLYEFPSEVIFNEKDEDWLSKLTLDFYLSLLQYDSSDPEVYKNVEAQTLLYDEVNPADIEGGGRVIVALKDGKFEAPADADNGLLYIGLNNNFDIVTEFIYK